MKKLILLLSIALIAGSCNRGPQGPVGPPGNANIWSFGITALPRDWIPNGTPGDANFSYSASFLAPELTPDIVDFGLVQAYVLSEFGWSALPFTLTEGAYETDLNYAYDYDIITMIIKDSDLQTQPFSTAIDFKIVIAQEGIGKIEIEKYLLELSDEPLKQIGEDL